MNQFWNVYERKRHGEEGKEKMKDKPKTQQIYDSSKDGVTIFKMRIKIASHRLNQW